MATPIHTGVFDGMEDATSIAILQIQLRDINHLLENEQQDVRQQNRSQSEWAQTLILQRDELRRSLILIQDRRLSIHHAHTIRQTENLMRAAIKEELQAEADHAMACRLAGLPVPPPRPEYLAPTTSANPRPIVQNWSRGLLALPAPTFTPMQAPNPVQTSQTNPPRGRILQTVNPRLGIPAPPRSVPPAGMSISNNLPNAHNFAHNVGSFETNAVASDWGASRARTGLPAIPRATCNFDKRPQHNTSHTETSKAKVSNTGTQKDNEASQKRSRDHAEDANIEPFAKRLKTGDPINASQSTNENSESLTQQTPVNGKRKHEAHDHCVEEPAAKRTDTGLSKQIELSTDLRKSASCVACGDQFFRENIATVECGHDYCTGCLRAVVQNSLTDEALYPPRCCRKPFKIESMRSFLTAEQISDFHLKKIEFGTANRTYCTNSRCSTFLYPINIEDDWGECPICYTKTCVICKGASHRGHCPKDEGVQQVLALATKNGWQRCANCNSVVELKLGCNHITCRCKSHWCYVCGAPWKTCACPIWDEARLIEHAGQDVDRRPEAVIPRPQQVAARVGHLRRYHGCDHYNWHKVGGGAECDECGRYCSHYFHECENCDFVFCYGCRLNRFY